VVYFLTSCTVVDQFSDRATIYNVETEKTRTHGLILNIIRSAYRKPLQFIDVPTITGQALATGSVGTVLPLGGPEAGYQINPSAMFSGGPTFNVSALNTKEFYLGILNPLSMQVVAFYTQEGYPPKLLLTLFVNKITISDSGIARTFVNRITPTQDFVKFQKVLDELIDTGLTTKKVESTQQIGPPLTPSQVATLEGISKLQAQGLDLVKTEDPNGRITYQVVQNQTQYVFCFDASLAQGRTELPDDLVKSHRCDKAYDKAGSGNTDELTLSTRSTEGIIYYLGEVARAELDLAGQGTFVPKLRIRNEEDTLFTLRRGKGDESLSVSYQGVNYTVARDPSGRDHGSQVLDLVEQLLALNSSSKDLPAPNVITISR
jgi:hypothetical protein